MVVLPMLQHLPSAVIRPRSNVTGLTVPLLGHKVAGGVIHGAVRMELTRATSLLARSVAALVRVIGLLRHIWYRSLAKPCDRCARLLRGLLWPDHPVLGEGRSLGFVGPALALPTGRTGSCVVIEVFRGSTKVPRPRSWTAQGWGWFGPVPGEGSRGVQGAEGQG